MAVSAAIAEVGEGEACGVLLANSRAEIASLSFRRMAERFGHIATIARGADPRRRLPAESRHMLLVKLGEALRQSPLVRALMGEAHAERVMRNACIKASLTLIDRTNAEEYPALIEHIRLRGDLTASFLVRAIAHGKVDFFGAALVALTGQAEERVRSLLATGFDTALLRAFRQGRSQPADAQGRSWRAAHLARRGARQARRRSAGSQLADVVGDRRAGRPRRSGCSAEIDPSRRLARQCARPCAGDRRRLIAQSSGQPAERRRPRPHRSTIEWMTNGGKHDRSADHAVERRPFIDKQPGKRPQPTAHRAYRSARSRRRAAVSRPRSGRRQRSRR